MDEEQQQRLIELIAAEGLPQSYIGIVQDWISPLSDWLIQQQAALPTKPLLVGINGAQGTGKTTLSKFLSFLLGATHKTLALSLDDFYLGRAARQKLARRSHPLLATRGVPGTHNLVALNDCLDRVLAGQSVSVPRFDKAEDEPLSQSQWQPSGADVQIVLLEGWCMGVETQALDALLEPLNSLEENEDADRRWRTFINWQLAGDYRRLFGRLDRLIMLQAPSMDSVYEWRQLQEQKLRQRGGTQVMDSDQVVRFVQHFERLTRHSLDTVPARCDYLLQLNSGHGIERAIIG